MPIKIPNTLPAYEILSNENIFVMTADRAKQQDIRPLKIAVLNLMPDKIAYETQLMRLLGNSPMQVDITLVQIASHASKNTSQEHLSAFYQTFKDIKETKYDGLIITGAPVETLPFEQVDYWEELTEIMEWSKTHVFSTFHICWGAQAGLYYHYGIKKYPLQKKMFGVYKHLVNRNNVKLLRGFDDCFNVPHSRHTTVLQTDILQKEKLEIISESPDCGVYIVATKDGRQIFVMGHSEYDQYGLKREYDRDIAKGMKINVPDNYFPDDNPNNEPMMTWRSHANLLFANWLNYYVYQQTPFNLNEIE